MTLVIPGMVTISLLSLFYCSMLPETARKARMQAFERQYIAHRGFHDNRGECPENSLPAFERAIQMGYGIELDVQLTKDGVPVVFHDWDLKRAAGVDRKIRDCTFEELQSYRLFGSSQTIPAFETVLELADGRTPLIIELKAEIVHRELCEKCAVLLDRYPGEYCIESFSPLALGWFKRHRPNVLRGQLATNYRGEGLKTPVIVREMLTYCMLNGFCRPDFIAYNCQFSNTLPVEMLRYFYKCKMAAWTIKNQGELNRHRKQFDVFIFDSFEPDQFVNFNKKHPER